MGGWLFFFSSRRRHTRSKRDWSSDVCSSDLKPVRDPAARDPAAIVAEIYSPKREEIYGAAFGLNVADRRKYLSKELVGLWARADKKANPTGKDAGPIDWDVTTNSQGLEVGSYALEVVR